MPETNETTTGTQEQTQPTQIASGSTLTAPGAGEAMAYEVGPGDVVNLGFPVDQVEILISGEDVVLRFADGGTITLENFAELAAGDTPPSIQLTDGTVLAGDVVVNSLAVGEIEAAAGPGAGGAGTPGGGGSRYSDDFGDLADGLDTIPGTEGLNDPSFASRFEEVGTDLPGGDAGVAGTPVLKYAHDDWNDWQGTGTPGGILSLYTTGPDVLPIPLGPALLGTTTVGADGTWHIDNNINDWDSAVSGGAIPLYEDTKNFVYATMGGAPSSSIIVYYGTNPGRGGGTATFGDNDPHGSGDDLILSTAAGEDAYYAGRGGSDYMDGGDGNDTMYGGSSVDAQGVDHGMDTLVGGAGIDEMYGQDGNDLLYIDHADLDNSGVGADGEYHGIHGDDPRYPYPAGQIANPQDGRDYDYEGNDPRPNGYDVVVATNDGATGYDIVLANYGFEGGVGSDAADTLDARGIDWANGGAGVPWNEYYNVGGPVFQLNGAYLEGQGGADTLYGSEVVSFGGTDYGGNDLMFGDENLWDTVADPFGDATLLNYSTDGDLGAGPHNDLMYGLSGDDSMAGGADGDTMDGGTGDDFMYGDYSDDLSAHDEGNDVMSGGDGDDIVVGDGGSDTMSGGADDDIMFGDYVWLAPGPGVEGADSMEGDGGDDEMYGGGGDDIMFGGTNGSPADSGNDSMEGGDGNDIMLGGDETDNGGFFGDGMEGGAGNDGMYGGTGEDFMGGGSGNDVMFGGGDDDIMLGDSGSDYMSGNADNDLMAGGDDGDFMRGGTGDDVMYGGNSTLDNSGNNDADAMHGEAGDDLMYGGSGADFMTGGDGADRMYAGDGVASTAPVNLVGAGALSAAITLDSVSGTVEEVSQTISGLTGDTYVLSFAAMATGLYTTVPNDTTNWGIESSDITVNVDWNSDGTIDETFTVSPSYQEYGDFTLELHNTGGADNVTITLGEVAGQDNGHGALIDDVQFYDADPVYPLSNVMNGDAGNDSMYGGDHVDWLYGGADNDLMYGYGDSDVMDGGSGDDVMYGGGNNDIMYGGAGNDEMYGGNGDDNIGGGIGQDTISGGAGDDVIEGGAGNDFLYGGAGNDTFLYDLNDHSGGLEVFDVDYIDDFQDGDRLVFTVDDPSQIYELSWFEAAATDIDGDGVVDGTSGTYVQVFLNGQGAGLIYLEGVHDFSESLFDFANSGGNTLDLSGLATNYDINEFPDDVGVVQGEFLNAEDILSEVHNAGIFDGAGNQAPADPFGALTGGGTDISGTEGFDIVAYMLNNNGTGDSSS